MNLGRIFANAIVRRLAYVLVAIALAWCGIGNANAQTCPAFTTELQSAAGIALNNYPDAAAALAACNSTGSPGRVGNSGGWHDRFSTGGCTVNTTTKRVTLQWNHIGVWSSCANNSTGADAAKNFLATGWGFLEVCPDGGVWDPETQSCGTCAEKPPLGPSAWSNVNASQMMCKDECVYEGGAGSGGVGVCFDQVIDGQRYTRCTSWGTTGAACSVSGPGSGFPGAPSSAPTDSDGDGTSDSNDGSPNNPGQGGGGNSDGEGPPEDGSGTCGGEGQPVCGSAGTGSGNGNTSGGGGDCNTPPTSTGDAILAQIAYQTWATRCAITGTGNAGPGGGGTGTGSGNGNGNGSGEQPDWTKGDGPAVPTDDTDYAEEQTRFGLGISSDLLDQENIFGNASCPAFEIRIWTATVSSGDFPGWCTLVTILRGLILIFGAFSALQILMGRGLV